MAFLATTYQKRSSNRGSEYPALLTTLESGEQLSRFNTHVSEGEPQPHVENLTGTRGAFKTYNTSGPKVVAWDPVVAPRQKEQTS